MCSCVSSSFGSLLIEVGSLYVLGDGESLSPQIANGQSRGDIERILMIQLAFKIEDRVFVARVGVLALLSEVFQYLGNAEKVDVVFGDGEFVLRQQRSNEANSYSFFGGEDVLTEWIGGRDMFLVFLCGIVSAINCKLSERGIDAMGLLAAYPVLCE